MAVIRLLGLFIFNIFISNTLDFWGTLRTPLHSWGLLSVSLFLRVFWRLQSCLQIYCPFSRKLLGLIYLISSGLSALASGLFFFVRFPGGLLVGFLSLVLPSWQGFWSSRIWPICDCKWFPSKSYPCLLFSSSCDGEGLDGIYSFHSVGLTVVIFLPCILWRGENKI